MYGRYALSKILAEINAFLIVVDREDYFIESGSYSHILVNMSYTDVLKDELNCSEQQFAKCLEMKNLSIVDGLEDDFVIIT